MATLRRCGSSGLAFMAAGIVFIGVSALHGQHAFLGVGTAFIGLGIALRTRRERK